MKDRKRMTVLKKNSVKSVSQKILTGINVLTEIIYYQSVLCRGVPRGGAQDARSSPPHPCASPPPAMCIPPLLSLKGWL